VIPCDSHKNANDNSGVRSKENIIDHKISHPTVSLSTSDILLM